MKESKGYPLRLVVTGSLLVAPLLARAGDGPYLGLEIGPNWESSENLTQQSNNIGSVHFGVGSTAGLVGGYMFSNGLRPELEFNRRRNDVRYVNGSSLYVGNFEDADSVFGNLWYDFLNDSGSAIHPYIGAGAGYIHHVHKGLTTPAFTYDYAYNFGFQGGAGLGFDLTRHLTLSTDYRYVQSAPGSFNFGDNNTTQARYRAQSLMVGMNYSFGPDPLPPPPPPPPPLPLPPPPPPPPPPVVTCQAPPGFQVDANCHIIEQTLVVRNVDFEFNSTNLTAPAMQTLDGVAAALVSQPHLYVEVRGYTDSVGKDSYNQKLSQRRAESVRTYLIGKGVNAQTLTATGLGKSNPIASNDTAEGRAQNRRVEFKVTNTPPNLDVVPLGATGASTSAAQQGEPHAMHKHHKRAVSASPTTPTADTATSPPQQ